LLNQLASLVQTQFFQTCRASLVAAIAFRAIAVSWVAAFAVAAVAVADFFDLFFIVVGPGRLMHGQSAERHNQTHKQRREQRCTHDNLQFLG
jgi:hypothetical protein